MGKSNPDSICHTDTDSGCPMATRQLGRQSHCLECPFPKCLLDLPRARKARLSKRQRNRFIRQQYRQGKDRQLLAGEFHLSLRTIIRITGGTP